MLLGLYQKLGFILMEYNRVYFIIVSSTQASCISFGMFCTYGGLKMHGILRLHLVTMAIFSISFLVMFLMVAGEFHSRSKAFINAARTRLTMIIHSTKIIQFWGLLSKSLLLASSKMMQNSNFPFYSANANFFERGKICNILLLLFVFVSGKIT